MINKSSEISSLLVNSFTSSRVYSRFLSTGVAVVFLLRVGFGTSATGVSAGVRDISTVYHSVRTRRSTLSQRQRIGLKYLL